MKRGIHRTFAAFALALTLQGCATSDKDATAKARAYGPGGAAEDSCQTVFYCPADPEKIRICRSQDQLSVDWQTPGIEAYRLTGTLGDTFETHYRQRFQVIENTLSWQYLGIRYTAYHYLDESRPETLEEVSVTMETGGQTRTINCDENAVSTMAGLHRTGNAGQPTPTSRGE